MKWKKLPIFIVFFFSLIFISTQAQITGTFTDSRDGYVYKWVIIGEQTWISENLRYLPSVVGSTMGSTTIPYYYVYGYEGTDVSEAKATQNYNAYGVLYNWSAAMANSPSSATNPSDIQGICPDGWNLPSEAEWVQLETYLSNNGYNYDGTTSGVSNKIAKAMAEENGWQLSEESSGALGSTQYVPQRNSSGFSALPAGNRGHGAPFYGLFGYGFWWSATESTDHSANYVGLIYRGSYFYKDVINKEIGFSARCIRNLPDILNPTTGKIWMDRNLGASQVATSSTDAASYGDLYQWGRAADGHQVRTSGTTPTLSSSNTPGHGNFIILNSSPYNWRSPQNDNLWQGVSGTNNPCPSGYRLPTAAEWDAEFTIWSNNAAGAFASPLKLPVAGFRGGSNGSLYLVGSIGYYWSSTVDGTYSRGLYFFSSNANVYSSDRANGGSVRCIKE